MHLKSNKLKVTFMLVSTVLCAIGASTVYANGEGWPIISGTLQISAERSRPIFFLEGYL